MKKINNYFIGLILTTTICLKTDNTDGVPVFILSTNDIKLLKPDKVNLKKIETEEELEEYYYRKRNYYCFYDVYAFYKNYYFFLKYKYVNINEDGSYREASDFLSQLIAYKINYQNNLLKDVTQKNVAIFASGGIFNTDMEYLLNKYSDSDSPADENTLLPDRDWYDRLLKMGEYDTIKNKKYCTGKTFYQKITFQKECAFCRSAKQALEKEPVKKLTTDHLLSNTFLCAIAGIEKKLNSIMLHAQENKLKKNFCYFLELQKKSKMNSIEYLIDDHINPEIEKIERGIEADQDYCSLVGRIKNNNKEIFLEDLKKMKEFLSKKISYVSHNLVLKINPEKCFSYHDLPVLEHDWDTPIPQNLSIYSLFKSYKKLEKLNKLEKINDNSFFCEIIKNYLNEYGTQNTQ